MVGGVQSGRISGAPIYEDDIVRSISQAERIPNNLPVRSLSNSPLTPSSCTKLNLYHLPQAYQLLGPALQRVLRTYELVEAAQDRAKDQYDGTAEQEDQLRQLWKRLKPDHELTGLVSKQWQEVSTRQCEGRWRWRCIHSAAAAPFRAHVLMQAPTIIQPPPSLDSSKITPF